VKGVSLCPLTIIRAPHRELVEAAAAGGFDTVGLRLIAPRPGDPMHPLVGDDKAIKDLGRLMADNGITLFDIESCWLLPATEPASIRSALEACAALGGQYVLVAGNDPEWNRLASNFAAVASMAAEYGLKVGIEPTSFCVLNKLSQANALLAQTKAANTGIIIDTLHMARAGETPASIAALNPRSVAYVQICDGGPTQPANAPELMAEARGARLLPGEGVLPLNAMLDALPPGLRIGVEAPTLELTALSVVDAARRAGEATGAFLSARAAR
jgi:sugar phosphate isomerase/epimerase